MFFRSRAGGDKEWDEMIFKIGKNLFGEKTLTGQKMKKKLL
jgi:hypothetical protein